MIRRNPTNSCEKIFTVSGYRGTIKISFHQNLAFCETANKNKQPTTTISINILRGKTPCLPTCHSSISIVYHHPIGCYVKLHSTHAPTYVIVLYAVDQVAVVWLVKTSLLRFVHVISVIQKSVPRKQFWEFCLLLYFFFQNRLMILRKLRNFQ